MKEQPKNYIDKDGDKFWYLSSEGKYYWHRLDGPAIEYANGTKGWYVDNKRHRLDGPAFEGANGSKLWYVDGKRHRSDGPAIERIDGSKAWWVDGKQIFPGRWLEENGIDPDNMSEEDAMAFKLRWF